MTEGAPLRLSHPADDTGSAEFTGAMVRLFAEHPSGVPFAAIEEFGWFELAAESPGLAVSAMFSAQGAALGAGATLEALVAHVARDLDGTPDWRDAAVLVEAGDRGFALTFGERMPSVLVAPSPSGGGMLVLGSARLDPVRSIDDSVGLVEVAERGEGRPIDGEADLGSLTAIGLALQLGGLSERLLGIGRDYALLREQFGRPIGAFQAVQHLLADAAVGVAAAESAGTAAVRALEDPARLRLAALVAAGAASRAATTTTRAVQQVLGAIGYTREHEFQRFLYRARLLCRLLDSATLDSRIAEAALAAGVAPVEPTSAWFEQDEGAA